MRVDKQRNIRSCVVMPIGHKTMQSETATSAKGRKSTLLLGVVFAGILGIAAISASGSGDFTSTSTEQSSIGNVITSDTSFTFSSAGVSVATNANAGTASAVMPQEIVNGNNRLRTNDVTKGHFVYEVQLVEASALSSGTWTVELLQDGSRVGNVITLTQSVVQAGNTEGATVVADLGTSLPSSNVFELKVVKTS
jgi:hypothetical protein